MPSVHETLEDLARSIRAQVATQERVTPRSLLELQIGFWSEELDRVREVQQDLLKRILRAECYVGTDLLALEGYVPKTWHYRLGARDNLKTKLLHLDVERRRLLREHERDLRDIRSRLLELLGQRALVHDQP